MMSLIEALFWSLLHSVWQGFVLHAGAWLVAARMRSAPQRYAVLCMAQFGLVLAYAGTLLGELSAAPVASVVTAPASAGGLAWLPGFMLVSVALWSVGLALMTARLLHAFRGVERLRQGAAPLLALQPALELAAARLGLRREVTIAEARVDSPLTLGWLKPVLLMPLGWAAQLPPQVVEAAILHELVHVKRHDFVVNAVQHIVETLFFYHPSVWWLSRKIREQRELCCDQAVVDSHLDPLDYASALVALEQQRGLVRPLAANELSLAVARGELSARVAHVLSRRGAAPEPRSSLPAAITALVVVGAVLFGACLSGAPEGDADEATMTAAAGEELEETAAGIPAPPGGPRWLPDSVSRFGAAIAAAAAAHGVDPALVSLVVLIESRGDPDAVSPGGAVGLMQVMPGTAAEIAAERGLAPPTLAQMREPRFNLDFGTYYLAKQLALFEGRPLADRVRLAAIAYNGGPRILRAHLDGTAALPAETQYYSMLLSHLWAERAANSSATYETLGGR